MSDEAPKGYVPDRNVLSMLEVRRSEAQKLPEAEKERIHQLSLEVRSTYLRKGALREDYLKWANRGAPEPDLEDDGESQVNLDVEVAAREALDRELERASAYRIGKVKEILSAYANPETREAYTGMQYYAAAFQAEMLLAL